MLIAPEMASRVSRLNRLIDMRVPRHRRWLMYWPTSQRRKLQIAGLFGLMIINGRLGPLVSRRRRVSVAIMLKSGVECKGCSFLFSPTEATCEVEEERRKVLAAAIPGYSHAACLKTPVQLPSKWSLHGFVGVEESIRTRENGIQRLVYLPTVYLQLLPEF